MDHRATLLALLKQRLETLIEAMPAAQTGDVRSVHQARVATRRLREALPVLGRHIHPHALGRARRQVRRMTRALGPVRELDVALLHLDEFAARNIVSTRATALVRQSIVEERLQRRRAMLQEVTPSKVEKLRHRLGHVATGPVREQSPGTIHDAERQVARRAIRLEQAIERAGGLYLSDRLHQVRVAAKKLRYALEIERELKRSRATARITQLKRLQDLLGRIHDFEILIERTRHVQADAASSDRHTALELDRLVRELEAECRKDHATYMRRRESIVKLCQLLGAVAAEAAVA
jgi:CHAD domain-containing protein